MNKIVIEVIIVFLLILGNGFFAMAELAILSARKTRLKQEAEKGNRGADVALQLAYEPSRFLSTSQIGITLIGILIGAFGGATIAQEIAGYLSSISLLAPYSEVIGVVIVVLGITYLSLVIGELVPKRIALINSEKIAIKVSSFMRTISRFATPLVYSLSISTEFVLKLLRIQPSGEPLITEEEIRSMILEGTKVGIFETAEQEIVERVFHLGDRKISTIMTYRTDIVWLDADENIEENLLKVTQSGHSRFPLCKGKLDEVLGIVEVKHLFAHSRCEDELDLSRKLRAALFVPESLRTLELLEKFKNNKEQISLIVDEFGGIIGLVTLNDVMETIVGDFPTYDELDEPDVVRREDGSLLIDGLLSIEELSEILQLDKIPDDETGLYETLGGLVMAELGRIPSSGDVFEWMGLCFEVLDMDGYRVDKVLVFPKT